MTKTLLDIDTLETFRSLQTESDPTFVKDFLTAFLNPLPEKLKAMGQAIGSKDYQKLRDHAHAIKSSCMNIGAAPIVKLCFELEQLGASGSVEGALEKYQEVIRLVDQLKKEILALPEFTRAA